MPNKSKNTIEKLCEIRKSHAVSTLMSRDERVLVSFLCSEIDKIKEDNAALRAELAELKGALKNGNRKA